MRLLSRPLPLALLIGLVAQLVFAAGVTTPRILVFDEIHYVPAARILLELRGPWNIEHPLFGKTLIALGITLFGDTPLGWRALSTIAGTATVLGLFAAAWHLFRTTRTAGLAALFALGNMTLFVQARIAMLDGFMGALIVGALGRIEEAFGRNRGPRNGPRTLDLDLIAYGRLSGDLDGLILPHPRAAERRFVMGPLAEIAPEWVHPAGGSAGALAVTASVGRDASRLP